MTTRRVIRATYSSPEDVYIVPKDLPLLSSEENDKAFVSGITGARVPFSWWIKWGEFHYYDKDGNKQTLEKHRDCEADYKYPMNIEDTEEECDSDEE
jgi:hypothetical protein